MDLALSKYMLAQAPNLTNIQNQAGLKLSFDSIGQLIGSFLPYVFGAAGLALLIYLVMGGFQLMLSRGDPKAIESARSKITSALVGFVIVIIAFFLVQLLGQILGIDAFREIFGGFGRTNP